MVMGQINKIELSDVTFVIPLLLDHCDRVDNINLVIDYINHHFNTNIIICECDIVSKFSNSVNNRCKYLFLQKDSDFFHKTKILNILYKESTTNIIVSHDSDVLLSVTQYVDSIDRIRNGEFDFAFPYSGDLLNVPSEYHNCIRCSMSIDLPELYKFKNNLPAPGGCFIFNKLRFAEAGLENQYFRSYGPEDRERLIRVKKLGYSLYNGSGYIVHLKHHRGNDSKVSNKYFYTNVCEYDKVSNMGKLFLKEYVRSWPWVGGTGANNLPLIANNARRNKRIDSIINTNIIKDNAVVSKPNKLYSMAAKQKIMESKHAQEQLINNDVTIDSIKDKFDNVVLLSSNNMNTISICSTIRNIVSYDNTRTINKIYVIDLGLSDRNKLLINECSNIVDVIKLPPLNKTFYPGYLLHDMKAWKLYTLHEAKNLGNNVCLIDELVVTSDISIIFNSIKETGIFVLIQKDNLVKDNISYRCKETMKCSNDELEGNMVYSSILGYNTGSRFSKLFEDAFRYSKHKHCIFDIDNNHKRDQTIYSVLSIRYSINYKKIEDYNNILSM